MRRENDPNFGKRKDKEREHKAPGKASNAAAPAAGAAAERARGASAATGGAGPSGAKLHHCECRPCWVMRGGALHMRAG